MKCNEVLEALSDYVDDDLDTDRGDEIDIHLESCPTCKACLNTFQRTVDFCKDTIVPPLAEEDLEALKEEARKAYDKASGGGKGA